MREQLHTEEAALQSLNFQLLRKLLAFLSPLKVQLFFALLLTIASTILGPLRPYLVKITIDGPIAKGNIPAIFHMVILIAAVLLLHGILQYFVSLLLESIGQRTILKIRSSLYDHLLKLDQKFFDLHPVGRLLTRVTNDIEALNQLFSSGFVMIIADILVLVWIVAFMFYIDVALTLIILASMPLLILISLTFRKKVRRAYQQIRKFLARMNAFLNELLSGIFIVKHFNQEQNMFNKFDSINAAYRDANIRSIIYYALFFPSIQLVTYGAIGAMLWYASGEVLQGTISIGTLIAFAQYVEMMFRPIRDISERYNTLQSAAVSSERIIHIFEQQPSFPQRGKNIPFEKLKKGIRFENVWLSYDNQFYALKGVSFEIPAGSTTALVGYTGAGKTSIFNVLLRFYEFQKGSIFIDERDIREYDPQSLRQKIAVVMQDVWIFSRTVWENISLGNPHISHEQIIEAAKITGADQFIRSLPAGYDTVLQKEGISLSTGQKQLIALTRALVHNPEILLLDEATANIDSVSEKIIEEALQKILVNRTSIVIAHRLATITHADQIIVFHDGKVVEIGKHHELLANGKLYSKLYQLQFRELVK